MLRRFRSVCPRVATSAGPQSVLIFHWLNKIGLSGLFQPRMAAFQVPLAFRGRPVATPDFISAAHRRNIRVEVWGVNGTDQMRRLIAAGADGIMTDFPDRLKSVARHTFLPAKTEN